MAGNEHNNRSVRAMLDTSASIVMIVGTIAMVWLMATRQGTAAPTRAHTVPVPSAPVPLTDVAVEGLNSARIGILEFSDFQCPYCGMFVQDTLPLLRARYLDAGIARLYFRHTPLAKLHPQATAAAVVAECARRQGRFWPMHDLLFKNRERLSESSLATYARQVELNMSEYDACVVGSGPMAVAADSQLAASLGVKSTPLFVIGRIQGDGSLRSVAVLMGAEPLSEFAKVIERLKTSDH